MYLIVFSTPHRYFSFLILPHHAHATLEVDPHEVRAGGIGREVVTGRDDDGAGCRDVPWRVSTTGKNKTMQEISNHQGKLSTTIGTMKQAITRYARQHNLPFAWQPRFHDRIIRNNTEMNQIAEYIENNVTRWEYDKFYG